MRKPPDLILLHPPSIYDFRKRNDIFFPYVCRDTTVKVTPMYEILPLGFYNIKTYLEVHNISVKIYNIASMMLKSRGFDTEGFLQALQPKIFGIDLHFMVHSHGALELAKVLKKIHGDIPILFGGISASYYYKELIKYPFVDFVIRGNITLVPIKKLMKRIIEKNRDYTKIPNLCYKKDGKVINTTTKIYKRNHFYPINWDTKQPQTKNLNLIMINPQSGCKYNCIFCGGSRYSTNKYGLQNDAILYKPYTQMHEELDSMKIFDSNKMKGKKLKLITINHWFEKKRLNLKILNKIKMMNLFSTVHLSLFDIIPISDVKCITKYANPVFEISPQSHDEKIRKLLNCAKYSNKELESWAEKVLRLKVRRIELYFMIGLPEQTETSVLKTVEYCVYLLERFKDKKNLIPFLSPMIPFLDPGSLAFENPQRYGYKIFFKTLEEHKRALTATNFRDRLNYETKWMSRTQIINVTYQAAKILTQEKIRYGYLPQNIGNAIINRMNDEHEMLETLNKIDSIKDRDIRIMALKNIEEKIHWLNKEILETKSCDQAPVDISHYDFWYEV